MADKITYNDKSHVQPYGTREIQVWDLDMNEIKAVINVNADETIENTQNIISLQSGYQGELLIADTPTADGYYLAGESGTYTNAGSVVVDLTVGITYINVSGAQTVFSKTVIPVDVIPTGEVAVGEIYAVSGDKTHSFFLEQGKNKIQIDEFLEDTFFNNSDGVLTPSATFHCTGYQVILPNTQYAMSNLTKDFVDKMHFFDSSFVWLGNNVTLGIGELNNPTWVFTTPSNCVYVGFTVMSADFTNFQEFKDGAQLELGNSQTVYEAVEFFIKDSLLLTVTDEDLTETPILNYYNESTQVTTDKGIDASGLIVPNSWSLTKIPVNELTDYSFKHNDDIYDDGQVGALGYYDSDSVQISFIDMDLLPSASGNGGKTLTTPSNCAFIWKNSKIFTSDYLADFQLERGGSTTDYENYELGYSGINDKPIIDVDLDNRVKVLENAESITNIDKVTWWLGDSITDNENYYLNKLNEKLSFTTQYNIANSGAKWSHESTTVYDITSTGSTSADWNVIWNQVNKMIDLVDNSSYEIPELIIISCGTNDLSKSVGTPSDVYDGLIFTTLASGDAELQNVSGGIRYSCDTILAEYPTVQIILVTPLQRGQVDNSKIFEITDVMNECGGYGSMETLDQARKVGVYGYPEISGEVYLVDNIHPNTAGGQRMADYLTKALKNTIQE